VESATDDGGSKAVFISRAGADADLAAVIGAILESAGHQVILQQWDFANRNFMETMHAALAGGARVVALLSPEYLRSDHCQAEWQNAIADDPLNTKSRLILLRVVECEPPGLLTGLAYWDLVPVLENRSLLADIVHDAVREDRRGVVPSGPYWRAPRSIVDAEAIRPVPSFSGRDHEIAAISAALRNGGCIAVLYGMGGVGKSSIVREYAWRNRESYAVIWWLGAQSEDAIVESLLRLGALFVRGLERHADRRAAAQQVASSVLSGFAKPVLLIFDDIDDERLLRTWLPRTGARALATSRSAAWSADIEPIALQTWELDVAARYLQRESGRSDLADVDARAVAEALGALPLALAHAAASLRNMRMATPDRYLQRIGEHLKNAPRNAEYPRSVYATFTTAIAQAEKEAPGAAAVLRFAASFAPDAIPDELFRQPIENCPEELRAILADDLRLDEALGALDRLSLLAYSPPSRTYGIHRLVQLAARDTIGTAARAWSEFAVEVANAAFPDVEFATWPQCERLLAHARAALDAVSDERFLPAGRLADRCALYLCGRGEYGAAVPLQTRALAILENVLGPDDAEVADATESLGTLYGLQDRFEDEARLHLRVAAIREALFGADHPGVSVALNNLALSYEQQGRYDEAATLYARSLAIAEKALGPDHPDVATTLNNLGNLSYRQGRYEEAERFHKRALAIGEKALGPDHPSVARSVNNLAVVYFRQGRLREAEPLQLRALAMHEKALGPDHPDVAQSVNSLANLYDAQGRDAEAKPLYLRALAIWETTLGSDHSKTKAVREKLQAPGTGD
jgi:tetratricopeptide (TPR) repeat protein